MPQPLLPALRRSLIALALTALLGCAPKDSDIMPAAATTQAPTYKDGTYTAIGTYGFTNLVVAAMGAAPWLA